MTTKAQLRKAALALPETEQQEEASGRRYLVRGREFATLTGDAVDLFLEADDAAQVTREHPAITLVRRGQRVTGVRVPLAEVNGMVLNALVTRAWRHRAPAQLRQGHDQAASGAMATDLPAIGRPATRALTTAGITSLDAVAARTEAELLELHGLGPRALRLLREALAAQGRSFS